MLNCRFIKVKSRKEVDLCLSLGELSMMLKLSNSRASILNDNYLVVRGVFYTYYLKMNETRTFRFWLRVDHLLSLSLQEKH